MGFSVENIDGNYRVKLSDEPSWVTSLQSGDGIAAIGEGTCLVIAFSVWSTPDRESAYRAIEVAKIEQTSVRICLLPYDYPEEMEVWLSNGVQKPGAVLGESRTDEGAVQVNIWQDEQTSPVWFIIQNGITVETRQGPLQDDEIARLLLAVTA